MFNSYGLDSYRRDPIPNQKYIDFVKKKYPLARYYIPETGRRYIFADTTWNNYYGGPSADNAADAWKFAAEELGYEG